MDLPAERFLELRNTAILALGVGGLSPYIKSIGLYNSKAKNIIATCQLLAEHQGGAEGDDGDD